MENIEQYIPQLDWNMILGYLLKGLGAILTLLIGLRVIKIVIRFLSRMMEKRNYDPTLRPFLLNLLSWTLKAMLFISVASMVGIQTTSFVAVIGAAGLAIGLALQGTLSNFAGGALLMIFKPYKAGDLIEAQGHLGVVKEIQIFTTILTSPENKMIIIPNGAISNGDITNYSVLGLIRVDLTMGISYSASIDDAKRVLLEVMTQHDKVLVEPAPFVGVVELADSSVNLAVRPHCKPEHYWDVYFDIYEAGKKALDAHNIEIPFPQIDVHMAKN